ncbi:MAG: 30S ribosomal protein S6 [Candidatus Omnitrophica bacterium]|nr:30S ribosomal protein S6 [Candidatus Omnitrophota bacterium]
MEHYEGIFVFKPDLAKDRIDKVLGQIKETIEKNKGSQDEVKEWGKQRMAYPVKKNKEGIYYLINFHIDPDAVAKIRKTFGLNESILRVLITRA